MEIEVPPEVEVPEVDLKVWRIDDAEDLRETQGYVDFLSRFARGSVFFNDEFEDHEQRRVWKRQCIEKFGGDEFKRVYDDRNRLSNNRLTACGKASSTIADILEGCGYDDVASRVKKVDKIVVAEMSGKDLETGQQVRSKYTELKDAELKKEIANKIVNETVRVLEVLAQGPYKKEVQSQV